MTPKEKLAYWLAQPPSEQRDYWIAAMNRIVPGSEQATTEGASA